MRLTYLDPKLINCAVASEKGEITIFHADEDNIGKTTTIPGEYGNERGVTVEAVPLQDLLTESEI